MRNSSSSNNKERRLKERAVAVNRERKKRQLRSIWAQLLTSHPKVKPGSEEKIAAASFLADMDKDGIEPNYLDFVWHKATGPRIQELREADISYFPKRILGIPYIWEVMLDIYRSVLANPKTSVGSGHNLGKTHMNGWIPLDFGIHKYQSEVHITAPRKEDLTDQLFAEMQRFVDNAVVPLGVEMQGLKCYIRRNQKWFIAGTTARKGGTVRGGHAKHLLYIFDEASHVPDEYDDDVESSMGSEDAHWLKTGNPTRPDGAFANSLKPGSPWKRFNLACDDHPNVVAQRAGKPAPVPSAIQAWWVDAQRRIWPKWVQMSRLDGKVPDISPNTVIPMSTANKLLDAERIPMPDGIIHCGGDVARSGGDLNVLTVIIDMGMGENGFNKFCLAHIAKLDGHPELRGPETWTWLKEEAESVGVKRADAERMSIDADNVGSSVVDSSYLNDWAVLEFHGGEAAVREPRKYANLRAECWFTTGEILQKCEWVVADSVDLEQLAALVGQLYVPKRSHHKTDFRIKVEGKDEIKARGETSPDFADSLVMGLSRIAPPRSSADNSKPTNGKGPDKGTPTFVIKESVIRQQTEGTW